MSTFRNRQPEGVPTGGQFATTTKTESDVTLTPARSGLSIDPACQGKAVQDLAAAGLKGTLAPYHGGDPDIPDGSLSYHSPEGHELAISGLGTGSTAIHMISGDPDHSFTVTRENATARDVVEGIEAAAWCDDLAGAFETTFDHGGENEVRDSYLSRNPETGDMVAGMTISDQDGNWFSVDHNYTTGETTAAPESAAGPGPLPDVDLDAVITDLTGKDTGGDTQGAAASAFADVMEQVRSHPKFDRYTGTKS